MAKPIQHNYSKILLIQYSKLKKKTFDFYKKGLVFYKLLQIHHTVYTVYFMYC